MHILKIKRKDEKTVLNPTIIRAFDIPEVWYRALAELYHAYSGGGNREYMVQHGSFANQHKRRELDYFCALIENPTHRPLAPIIPEGSNIVQPTNQEKIERYFANYLMGTEVAENEDYTYGSRINYKAPDQDLSQLERVIEMLRTSPNTNQAIIEIGRPEDIYLPDPPCLRLIDCRVKEGHLHLFIYFRSWDLYAGLPENLGGLAMLMEYMTAEIGIKPGSMVIQSKGAHVYDYLWESVKELVKYNA